MTDLSAWSEDSAKQVWERLANGSLLHMTINNEEGAKARTILWADSQMKRLKEQFDDSARLLAKQAIVHGEEYTKIVDDNTALRAENARLRAAELVAKRVDKDQREFQRWTLDMPKYVYDALVAYRRAYGEPTGSQKNDSPK